MHTFFHGWRRKAGCGTLVMALLLMGGWIRSLSILDEMTVHGRRSNQTVASMNGFLSWSRFAPQGSELRVVLTHKAISPQVVRERRRSGTYDWKWECCGFLFGAITEETLWWSKGITLTSTEEFWQAPYWGLTLPVTCLSAWLLLAKPRKRVSRI